MPSSRRTLRSDGYGRPGEPPAPGYIRDIVERFTPSVLAVQAAGLHNDSDIIDTHIQHTVDLNLDRSRVLAEQVAQSHVGVVGLAYHLAEGKARRGTDQVVAASGPRESVREA